MYASVMTVLMSSRDAFIMKESWVVLPESVLDTEIISVPMFFIKVSGLLEESYWLELMAISTRRKLLLINAAAFAF